jgi:predicted  nucleic acid-binding Zn-ribbon protein
MIVKCARCKLIEELSQDEIERLVNTAKVYNDDVSPNDYIAILSIIKGKCKDGKKHLYIYDETFSKIVADLVGEHNKLCENNASKEKEVSEILQKIEALQGEIETLRNKKDDDIKEIGDINTAIDNLILTFEKETGTRNVKMWS